MSRFGSAFRAAIKFEKSALERQLALVCLILALALRIWDPVPIEALRLKTFDLYQWVSPWSAPGQTVAIIDIDEESLAQFGQWPWPRTIIADLVTRLVTAGAVAIGFDIVFSEPDRMSASTIAESLGDLDPDIQRRLKELPSNDDVMARAIKKGRVVLGQSGFARPKRGQGENLRKTPIAEIGQDPRPNIFNYPGLLRNIPVLENAAMGFGMITLSPERDGVARRVAGVLRVGDEIFPALTLELLRVATGQNALGIKTDAAGIKSILVAGVEIPTDKFGRVWVHFSPHDRLRYVSVKDIFAGIVPAERIRGKLVLVGTSALGLQDIRATPLQSALPGVEVHAQMLENILAKHILTRPNWAIGAELSMILAVSLLLIFFVPKWGPLPTLMAGTAGAALYAGGVAYFFVEKALLIELTYPMLATFTVYVVLAYTNYIREEAQKRQVRDAFSHYMSPDLVEQLAAHPEQLKLGGEMKDLTLLFCDIRGFTAISEQYDAERLTQVINRFLTPMTKIILDHQGTIDKYIGDCIMAFWNAPLDDNSHARHACNAALQMFRDLEYLNDTWRGEAEARNEDFLPLNIGIGINSGLCAVGNMGSDQRFDYSVLGDDVNLAARLEGQTKEYGVDIIIGENTQRILSEFALLELDLIQVKGKKRSVRIFALLGDPGQAKDSGFIKLSESHQALLEAYRAQKWDHIDTLVDDSVKLAREWREDQELDRFYGLYRERARFFAKNPPGPEWDGIYTATTK